jgi:hypothetical protein
MSVTFHIPPDLAVIYHLPKNLGGSISDSGLPKEPIKEQEPQIERSDSQEEREIMQRLEKQREAIPQPLQPLEIPDQEPDEQTIQSDETDSAIRNLLQRTRIPTSWEQRRTVFISRNNPGNRFKFNFY